MCVSLPPTNGRALRPRSNDIPAVGEPPDPDGIAPPVTAVSQEIRARVRVVGQSCCARQAGNDLLVGQMIDAQARAFDFIVRRLSCRCGIAAVLLQEDVASNGQIFAPCGSAVLRVSVA